MAFSFIWIGNGAGAVLLWRYGASRMAKLLNKRLDQAILVRSAGNIPEPGLVTTWAARNKI